MSTCINDKQSLYTNLTKTQQLFTATLLQIKNYLQQEEYLLLDTATLLQIKSYLQRKEHLLLDTYHKSTLNQSKSYTISVMAQLVLLTNKTGHLSSNGVTNLRIFYVAQPSLTTTTM